jgi:thymidylate kinase
MKKLVVIINGNGGVGKDTLCEFAKDTFVIRNISAITPIKEIASAYGWKGEKDAKARKFLADLKAAFIDYNDLPFLYIKEQYHSFLEDEKEEVLFIHIREAQEIEKVKQYVQTPCITLLITREQKKAQCWGNPSDDNVACYAYDYQYSNDKKLVEARQDFIGFLQDVFEKSTQ